MRLSLSIGMNSEFNLTDLPGVSSVSPSIGDTAGGVAVTVAGTNLTGVSEVTIGGSPCTSVVVVNDTTITCVTPALSLGLYDVSVYRGGTQGATLASAYDSWDFIAAGAIADWAADSGITTTGSGVSTWLDKSASHFAATQTTDSARPPAGNDGHAKVTFNGTTHRIALPSINTSSNWTVFLRATVDSKKAFSGPVSLSGQAVPGPFIASHSSSTTTYLAWLIGWNGSAEVAGPFDASTIAIPAAEGNWMYKSDGGYRYAGAARTTTGSDSGLSHGNFLGWSQDYFGMKVREFVIFGSLVSAATVTLAERYLTAKWS